MTHDEAFLNDIRDAPDDDGLRLIYADWLEENGQAERAEFIRTQIELARLPEDHSERAGLAEREAKLLREHARAWTDGAYLAWLGHSKGSCPCDRGHSVCKLTAQSLRTRLALDELPSDAPKRLALEERLEALEAQAEKLEFIHYECHLPLFDKYEFRRGFIEQASVNELVFTRHPHAVAEFTVLRHLEVVLDDSTSDITMGDLIVAELGEVLDRTRLETLLISTGRIEDPESMEVLAGDKRLAGLRSLEVLWLSGEIGDSALLVLASSPCLPNLRSLTLYIDDRSKGDSYSEAALLELIRSDRLPNLTDCHIYTDAPPHLSPETLKLYQARFGRPRPDADRA